MEDYESYEVFPIEDIWGEEDDEMELFYEDDED